VCATGTEMKNGCFDFVRIIDRLRILMIAVLVLFTVQSCDVAKQTNRSPESDALLRAARAGNADTVRTLLASPNVDVNGTDEHGNTALIEAARFGHDEVVTALLIGKADVKTKNDEGKTALMLAAEGGHDEVVRMLTEAGAGK
jgi:ankyrin repeat protein